MPSLNTVFLLGHCGKDPDINICANDLTVANVSLATTEKFKNKATGEWEDQTEWHRLVFFGKTAETVEKYVRKGSLIWVEGKIQTKEWEDSTGTKRYTTQINCKDLKLFPKGGGNSDGTEAPTGRDNENLPGQYAKDKPQKPRIPKYTNAGRTEAQEYNEYAKAKGIDPYYKAPSSPDELGDDMPF